VQKAVVWSYLVQFYQNIARRGIIQTSLAAAFMAQRDSAIFKHQ